MTENKFDIAKNIKVLEWLKADLVSSVGALMKAIIKGREEAILDCLAAIIMTCYILAKRLGFSFGKLDLKIDSQLEKNIRNKHQVEEWFGDLSLLQDYLDNKR